MKKHTFKAYAQPAAVGWAGWYEAADGTCTGVRDLDGNLVLMSELD